MKYLIPLIFILISCSKENSSSVNSKSLTAQKPHIVETKVEDIIPNEVNNNPSQGIYEVFLGVHNIEYFADRMVLKSKRAGYDFASKKEIGVRDGRMHYQVVLGPFQSLEEAQKAENQIKILTPDLTISRIVKK